MVRNRKLGPGYHSLAISFPELQSSANIAHHNFQHPYSNDKDNVSDGALTLKLYARRKGSSTGILLASETVSFKAAWISRYKVGSRWRWGIRLPEQALANEAVESACSTLAARGSAALENMDGMSPSYSATKYDLSIMSDFSTKNFKKVSGNGGIVNNPMSSRKTSATFGSVSQAASVRYVGMERAYFQSSKSNSRGSNRAGVGVQYVLLFKISDSQSVSSDSTDALLNYVHQWPSSFNAQVAVNAAYGNKTDAGVDMSLFVAERQSTINMVANRIKKLISIVKDLKSGRWRKWAPKAWKKFAKNGKLSKTSILEGFSSAWLEARYGWAPLIMDVNGLIKTFAKGSVLPRQTFRGYHTESDSADISYVTDDGKFEGTYTRVSEARAGVLTSVNVTAAHMDRWGLMTWVNTAWELVPFSFVIDWFIDISSLLRATSTFIYEDLASWVTKKESILVQGTLTNGNQTIPVNIDSVITKREPNQEPSYISLNINLNYTRLTDAAALLFQLRK